jgi:membrane protein YdbS with pleckstrin-like domain
MNRVSKKAIAMWIIRYLTTWKSLAILVSWFILGDLWLYFGPQQNLKQIISYAIIVDKWIFIGLSVVLTFLIFSAVSNAFYKYWSLGYSMEASDLKIVKGIIMKHENYIPYRNIDSIDIRVGSAQRLWGLASILIFTPGAHDKENPDSAEGYIEGLKYDDAVVLKDELLKRMGQSS